MLVVSVVLLRKINAPATANEAQTAHGGAFGGVGRRSASPFLSKPHGYAKSGSWLSALFVGYGGAEELVILEITSLTSACI